MDATNIVSIISTVGFPIVMCLLVCWYAVKLNETHNDEVNTLAEVVNKNTDAISNLQTMLETILKMGRGE